MGIYRPAVIIKTLATWRATELITDDEVSRPAREWVAKRWPDSRVSYLMGCKACVSVWAAMAVLLLPGWLAKVLGLSGATMLLNEVRDHVSQRALQRRMTGGRVRRESEGGEVPPA